MDLTQFSCGLSHIATCYGALPTKHNLELTINQPVLSRDPNCDIPTVTGFKTITLYATVSKKGKPYIESQDTENNTRILLEGQLMVGDQDITFDYSGKINALFLNQGEQLNGIFYPVITTQSSIADAGNLHLSLGKKISGYFEIND